MTQMFGATVTNVSTALMKANECQLLVSGKGNMAKALVQNVSIQFSEPIQLIREIGSNNVYQLSQPPAGQLSIGRFVAKDKTILDIFPIEGTSVWNAGDNPSFTLTSISNATSELPNVYTLKNVICNSIGVNVDAEGGFVQEQLSFTFTGLDVV